MIEAVVGYSPVIILNGAQHLTSSWLGHDHVCPSPAPYHRMLLFLQVDETTPLSL